jgi:tetratricopeptide (TPR) repeat protein
MSSLSVKKTGNEGDKVIANLRRQNTNLEINFEKLEAIYHRKMEELELSKKAIKDLKGKVETLEKENEDLKEKTKKVLEILEKGNKELKSENEELKRMANESLKIAKNEKLKNMKTFGNFLNPLMENLVKELEGKKIDKKNPIKFELVKKKVFRLEWMVDNHSSKIEDSNLLMKGFGLLGDMYEIILDFEKALKYHKKALEIAEEIHKKKASLELAYYLERIGSIYRRGHKYKEGLKFGIEALSIIRAIYKDPHHKVAYHLNSLGEIYREIGTERKRALEYFKAALEMAKEVCKKPHVDIARYLYNVGNCYLNIGEYFKNKKDGDSLSKLLSLKILRKDKIRRNEKIECLDDHFLKDKKDKYVSQENVKDFKEEIREIYKFIFSEHPEKTLKSGKNLTPKETKIWMKEFQRNRDLMKMKRWINSLFKNEDKKESKKEKSSLGIFGGGFFSREEFSENEECAKVFFAAAKKRFEEALEMAKKVCGKIAHPDVAFCLNGLGVFHERMSNLYRYGENEKEEKQKSLKYYQEALKTAKEFYKDTLHPDIASYLKNLGGLKYSKKALKIARKIYIYENRQNYGKILEYLNQSSHACNRISKHGDLFYMGLEIDYDKEALELIKKIYKNSPMHSSVAFYLTRVGDDYYRAADKKNEKLLGEKYVYVSSKILNLPYYEKALKYYEEALKIMKKIHKNNQKHEKILEYAEKMKKIREKMAKIKQRYGR